MSQLSTFYSSLTAADLGLGNSANVTFGSVTTGAVTASGTLSGAGFTNRFAAPGPIGSTTPSTGAFTTLTANNGTLTASAPALTVGQTWNGSGVVFHALQVEVTNTLSNANSTYFRATLGGNLEFEVRRGGSIIVPASGSFNCNGTVVFSGQVSINSTGTLAFTSGTGAFSGQDTFLRRDAANTIAQYNSTNAQTFNIYNTFTSSTNHERLRLGWSSNVAIIGTEKGSGGGTARALEFQTDGVTRLTIATGGGITVAGSSFTVTGSGTNAVFSAAGSGIQLSLRNISTSADSSIAGITLTGNLTASTRNIVTDTTTGTRIGTGTTQLLGFWNATPSAQPAAVADATDAASTQARLNDLLARLRTIGIIAT